MTKSTDGVTRRRVVSVTAAGIATALAGCSSGGDNGTNGNGDGNTVAAGPNGNLVFEAETITISTGETVTWEFKSSSHNVSAWPEMHEKISIPENASGFGTMAQGGDKFETVPSGETFSHTFETAGEYTYVCIPHAASGMVGTVVVE